MEKISITGCEKHDLSKVTDEVREAGATQRALASITSDNECSNQLCGQELTKKVEWRDD